MRRPAGKEMAPVVIMVPGLDSTKEELESYETPFLDRGIATLCIDGPGQGEAEYEMPIRADYEAPIRAVVDWIERYGKVDSKRVGICGVSLGGYYAPRAAAFETRVKACIGLSGPYSLGDNWERLPQLSRDVFRVRSHLTTLDEARRHSETLTLGGGIARQIECPLFLVTGKQDRLIDWRDANRLAAEVSGPVTVIAVEDGNHIANNRPYRYRHQMADWIADQLGVGERARATP
jgi:2,6-dihydroxypseudooxynicotine hydrolase